MMTRMTDLVFAQLESLAEDDDRPRDECRLLKIQLRELRAEFVRLEKIETAASRIAQQTNPERAYALHDDLIAVLAASEVVPKWQTSNEAAVKTVPPADILDEARRHFRQLAPHVRERDTGRIMAALISELEVARGSPGEKG